MRKYAFIVWLTLLLPAMAVAQKTAAKPAGKKLSKEETVAYINSILKQSAGFRTYGISNNERVCTATITKYVFTPHTIDQHENEVCDTDTRTTSYHTSLTGILWENATAITAETEPGLYRDAELALVRVAFSSKVRYDKESDRYGAMHMSDALHYRDDAWMLVPVAKVENFKKALERLIEISKEENKDPFEN